MRSLALVLSLGIPALAGQPLSYTEGATRLVGYVARPAALKGKAPGVVVIHQWMGLTDHERRVSDDLAKLGYVALAADIYGEGVRPANTGEAGKLAGSFKGDRALYRRRIAAALEALKAQKGVDGGRIAVIGFCFGGTGALEAARAGLPVKGVVSFHGGLDVPEGDAPAPIAAKVLVCHGADDPFVPAKDVAAFQEEMRRSKADYVFVAYAGAVHAFTQKEAGNDNSKGAAYNEAAHRRSWQHMRDFLKEVF
ncbi:MAG: dienelactone hydrolase family protein [Acidobacteria bacterium]|nr:dienelactone hydrolase family protein [Acidobacteriota bacterium]MBI3487328.1 dienelactone hydrolase family protein [Acidobacteriota bacterium]